MSRRRSGAESTHAVGGLFTFALLGIFALLSLLIVVIGVDGYRNVVDQNESVDAIRTSLGYIAGKVYGGAGSAGISYGPYGGVDALVLTQMSEDGEPLETIIYHWEGAVHEQFINANEMEFDPEFGFRLVEIESLEIVADQPNLLRLTAAASDGRTQTLHVALRAEQEVMGR